MAADPTRAPSELRWSVLEIVEALSCAVYGDVADDAQLAQTRVDHACIDTREVRTGSLFVALQGANSHGIEHAPAAFAAGASAVLVGTDLEIDDERWSSLLSMAAAHGPVLVVTDCDGVTMLGRLARAHRRRSRFRVVGITGSSGKTSTKDILRALLVRAGFDVVASHANWNNEIGVPLTLLAAGPETTDVVICEMGMRGPGQIAWLCDIADPDVGIVTTAGSAHLELLGSREAIVAAKAEVLAGTWRGGVGIFPGAQPELVEAAAQTPDRLLPFGMGPDEQDDSAILVTSVERTESGLAGTIDIMGAERAWTLPVHGLHQARNLAAATAALVALTGSIELLASDVLCVGAAEARHFTAGRGQRSAMRDGGIVIDDTYNANPESMAAALAELAATPLGETHARRIAILGRMAELGTTSPQLHAQVGMQAAGYDAIAALIVIGDCVEIGMLASGWERARGEAPLATFATVDDAIEAIESWTDGTDVLLFKASNSAGLGRLARAVVERFERMEDTAL